MESEKMTDNEMKELRRLAQKFTGFVCIEKSEDYYITQSYCSRDIIETRLILEAFDHIDRLEKQVSELREALEKYESGNVKCTSYTCGASDDNGE